MASFLILITKGVAMSLTNSQKERAKWKDKIVQQQNSNKNISQW